MFNKLKNLTNSFFDGLKTNAINKAVKSAEKNVRPVPPIIQRMTELEKASKQLEDILKEVDPDYESKEE